MDIIKNAVITSASVTLDREYFLSVWVGLKFDDYHQNFGGYVLGKADDKFSMSQGNYAAVFIAKCLAIAGVENLDQMKGKAVRVMTTKGWNATIKGIGHIIKDEWLIPDQLFEEGN